MCSQGDPLGDFFKGIIEMITDPVGSFIGIIAKLILSGAIAIFGALMAEIPTLGEEGEDVAVMISDQVEWAIVYLAIGSIIFAAGKMAVERKGEAGKTALQGFLRVILVAGAGTWIVNRVAVVAEDFSDHLMRDSIVQILADVPCVDNGDGITGFLLLVIAFLLLISAIIQVLMLYIRLGVLVILLGTLPLAAAASMTNWGASWWRKHIAWLIAWLLYKPAVALIIYSGAKLLSWRGGMDVNDGVHHRIAGAGVLLLSAIALPALLKLIVPATAALGGGNPAGNAATAAGGAVATGAKKVATGALTTAGATAARGGGGPSGSRDAGGSASGGRNGSSGVNDGAGSQGGSGAQGGPGQQGDSGRVPVGAGAGGGGGAAAAAARAAGPVGAVVGAVATGVQVAQSAASGAVEGGGTNPDL
ncbi:hypothetical protein ACN28G_18330 [Micromonospora sp. WMMA1923]|uniref:hypothetical protein n=1 Tax=Micromonospora sp. WMMA1923 TaxID=3404125 RepID=UPI003B952049